LFEYLKKKIFCIIYDFECYVFFKFLKNFIEMNTKSELISKYDSRYKVVCVVEKIIILDFAEMNVVVPFPLLLKIVSEFQFVLGYYYYFIIIGCM
jgi:hypothetical protein